MHDYAAWTKMMPQYGHEKDARVTANTPPEPVAAEPEINMSPPVPGGVPTSGLVRIMYAGRTSPVSWREGGRRIQGCPAVGTRHHRLDRTGARSAGRDMHRPGVRTGHVLKLAPTTTKPSPAQYIGAGEGLGPVCRTNA